MSELEPGWVHTGNSTKMVSEDGVNFTPAEPDDSIDWQAIRNIDEWLDHMVAADYHNQPLAQDWARVCKVGEENGEAIAELILMTGQNPRKGIDIQARQRLYMELADTAITAILAIQHFTKDVYETRQILKDKLRVIEERGPEKYSL